MAAGHGADSGGRSQGLVTGADGRKDAGLTDLWERSDPAKWCYAALPLPRAFPHSLPRSQPWRVVALVSALEFQIQMFRWRARGVCVRARA